MHTFYSFALDRMQQDSKQEHHDADDSDPMIKQWQTEDLRIQPAQLGSIDIDALCVIQNKEDLLERATSCGIEIVADGLQDDLSCCLFGEASTGDRRAFCEAQCS